MPDTVQTGAATAAPSVAAKPAASVAATPAANLVETLAVSKAESWLRQPTTINGIGLLVGGLAVGLMHAAFHDTTISAVAGAFGAGVVHLVMNDSTAAPGP